MNTHLIENQPIACDLTAIPASVREEHVINAPKIFQATQEVQELPDGYAFRLLNEPGMFMVLAQFIENERLCCPFYHFVLEIEPNGGPIWLRLTGSAGVKQLLETALGEPSADAVFKQLIRTGSDEQLEEAVAQAAPLLAGTIRKTS